MDMPVSDFLDSHVRSDCVSLNDRIAALVSDFSIEVTAQEIETETDIASLLPAGTHVYLPFLPNSVLADCVDAAETLAGHGMVPVLHLAARRIGSAAELTDVLARLTETAGLRSVLVIGGDVDHPAGPYGDSMSLIETGLLEGHGIARIGIAGYPDGHPAIPDSRLREDLALKCAYAKTSSAAFRIVTQFTFSHHSLARWEVALREANVTLPVHVSVPGPARLTTLLGYARRCGVSASLRQLTRNTRAVTGLATVRTPDRLVAGIARYAAATPETLIGKIHFNTFGGFGETARWVQAARAGGIDITPDGEGFSTA